MSIGITGARGRAVGEGGRGARGRAVGKGGGGVCGKTGEVGGEKHVVDPMQGNIIGHFQIRSECLRTEAFRWCWVGGDDKATIEYECPDAHTYTTVTHTQAP